MRDIVRPSGLVAFVFTDVEGSTPLWEESPQDMATALKRHDELLREAFAAHGGYVFSTAGDAFSVAFARAVDAVEAVVAAQASLEAEQWPAGIALRVRAGVHVGEADERDGDYFGPVVNRAARIASAAHGNQTLLSEVAASLAGRVDTVDLGVHRLRGIDEPMRVFQLGQATFPPLRGMSGRGNLPPVQSSFIGRADDVAAIGNELGSSQVLTLTGVGGVGKTRLALEVARSVSSRFRDGAWFCELAAIGDSGSVAAAVAADLGIRGQVAIPAAEAISEALTGREMLVILDNCEHVLGPAAQLVGDMVNASPASRVITTSREPLGIGGERVWPVRSLETDTEAIDLFLARAHEADLSAALPDRDREVVERICGRLDGIPLAIELAAAKSRSMSFEDIDQRLDDRFVLLRGAGRGGVERHQTLQAAISWSYGLLSDAERLLFDWLCVFTGPFDLAAVEALCDGDAGVGDVGLITTLTSLVDKSMLVADRSHRNTRYSALETIRQFGEQRLVDDGTISALRDRHLSVSDCLCKWC